LACSGRYGADRKYRVRAVDPFSPVLSIEIRVTGGETGRALRVTEPFAPARKP
jgi:hypothetical protein